MPESADVLVVRSERLDLIWMAPEFLQASLDRRLEDASRLLDVSMPDWWPDKGASRRMSMRLEQMVRDPNVAAWLLRAIVRRSDRQFLGYINFHGPPDDGRAELGYTVFEEHRRQGYASEAALALMRWANERHGVEVFVVSISPDNVASLGMAAKLGFQRVGTQIDEIDGLEWVFELSWTR